jgi:hypothetical protein
MVKCDMCGGLGGWVGRGGGVSQERFFEARKFTSYAILLISDSSHFCNFCDIHSLATIGVFAFLRTVLFSQRIQYSKMN